MSYSIHNYPPSPASPLSHKSPHNYANNMTLSSQNLNEVQLTPEELARIDASLTNFFQSHPLTTGNFQKETTWQRNGENLGNESISMSLEPLIPTIQKQTQQRETENNNHLRSFVRNNHLDRFSTNVNNHLPLRTSPNTYQHPQSDPFVVDNGNFNTKNFHEVSDSMKAQVGESVKGMPPTPPVTSSIRKDLPPSTYPQQYYQPQFTQFAQTQPVYGMSSPFPIDMKAFDDMKRLYEERIHLIEVKLKSNHRKIIKIKFKC
jgi:hypothetical protein